MEQMNIQAYVNQTQGIDKIYYTIVYILLSYMN